MSGAKTAAAMISLVHEMEIESCAWAPDEVEKAAEKLLADHDAALAAAMREQCKKAAMTERDDFEPGSSEYGASEAIVNAIGALPLPDTDWVPDAPCAAALQNICEPDADRRDEPRNFLEQARKLIQTASYSSKGKRERAAQEIAIALASQSVSGGKSYTQDSIAHDERIRREARLDQTKAILAHATAWLGDKPAGEDDLLDTLRKERAELEAALAQHRGQDDTT